MWFSVAGIISQRMAGKLRYMDSRSDEQLRGITMKSSSISLFYKEQATEKDYIINLIDSPGHVDFSNEVSTAVRLCDGALVLVKTCIFASDPQFVSCDSLIWLFWNQQIDVIEGVCPQTRICLKQAYMENIRPILVLNKMDRLIIEKQLTPLDAYVHISQILEQVNAVVGNIFASDVMAKEEKTDTVTTIIPFHFSELSLIGWLFVIFQNDYVSALEESDDSNIYFTPESGNVVFCSAVDGWAFRTIDFARIYASKLGIATEKLEKVLWGDFYYSPKEKSYVKGAQEKAKKPMFVQFILENIWNLYDVVAVRKDKEKIPGIAEKLGVKLNARDLRQTDPKVQIQAIFSQWLPIEKTILEIVVRIIPHPGQIADEKAERLMCSLNQDFQSLPKQTQLLKKEFIDSNANSDNVIVFISKMVSVDRNLLPENKPKPLTQEEIAKKREVARQRIQQRNQELEAGIEQLTLADGCAAAVDASTESKGSAVDDAESGDESIFIAFARVYSGTLKKGSKIFALNPKHDPSAVGRYDTLLNDHVAVLL